jgi:hypothetical protein
MHSPEGNSLEGLLTRRELLAGGPGLVLPASIGLVGCAQKPKLYRRLSVETMASRMTRHGVPTIPVELNYVARTVVSEAGGRGYDGMRMVAEVIVNRWLKDNYTEGDLIRRHNTQKLGPRPYSWGNRQTLYAIVRQPNQFATFGNVSSAQAYRLHAQDIVHEVAITAALSTPRFGRSEFKRDYASEDTTNGSLYFYNRWHVWPWQWREWGFNFPAATDGLVHDFYRAKSDNLAWWYEPELPVRRSQLAPRSRRR